MNGAYFGIVEISRRARAPVLVQVHKIYLKQMSGIWFGLFLSSDVLDLDTDRQANEQPRRADTTWNAALLIPLTFKVVVWCVKCTSKAETQT